MGPVTSSESIFVNISTLRSATRMVDPSFERESDRGPNYDGFKIIKPCYKNLIPKSINLGPL